MKCLTKQCIVKKLVQCLVKQCTKTIFHLEFLFRFRFRNHNAEILYVWNIQNIMVVFARQFSIRVPFFFFFLETCDWTVCEMFDKTVYSEEIGTISSKTMC